MKISLLEWSDKFSVGNKEIDQQHKKLMNLINELRNSKQNNGDSEATIKIINELLNYTKTHFACEERLMQQSNYPEYNIHKFEHERLAKKVDNLQNKSFAGNNNAVDDLTVLFNDWLSIHILIEDKKFAPYLNGKGET